jgi:hypothetical protein
VSPVPGEYLIELLNEQHVRTAFSCGVEVLDRYLRDQAGQDSRRHIAAVYVLSHAGSRAVTGFYTLANSIIQLDELPAGRAKKLPRYPQVPATLLGRLAVDLRHRDRRLGEFLLIDAMKRTLEASHATASYALVVDAKDETAKAFYLRYGFESIASQASRLFLPMQDIKRNFGGSNP